MRKQTLLLLLGILCGFVSASVSDSVVQYLRFDTEVDGVSPALVGTDAALMGNATITTGGQGITGEALQLDGVPGSFAQLIGYKAIGGNAPRTVSLWVKTTVNQANGTFFMGWGDTGTGARVRYDLGLQSGTAGQLRNEFNAGAATSATGTPITDDVWHHIAVTYDGNRNVAFYLDGDPYGTAALTWDLATLLTEDVVIGTGIREATEWGTLARWTEGLIDDVAIFDRALTAEEIAWISNNPGQIYNLKIPVDFDPPNGAEVGLDQILTWGQTEEAAGLGIFYEVYFGTDSNSLSPGYYGNNLVKVTSDDPEDFFYVPTLVNDAVYYWRVDAMEPNEPNLFVHSGPELFFTTAPANAVVTHGPISKTIEAGTTAVFSITAINAQTYQWYKDGTLLSDGGTIRGATTATLTIENVQVTDEGFYHCEVDNSLLEPDISEPARLMTRRLVAHWPLNGTLQANVTHPDENWDGVYVDPNEPEPLPAEGEVEYVIGADGAPQGAVKFNGESVVMIPDSAEFFNFHPQGLTLTAWVLGPSGGDWRRPVNKGASYAIVQQAAGWIDTLIQGGPWQNAIPADKTDVWRFVAMTYDPETSERVTYGIYDADGPIEVLNRATLTQTDIVSGGTNVIIGGASAAASTYNYPGSVADVRIYNYALDALGVIEVYHDMLQGEPVCTDPDDPKLRYDFNNDCRVDLADFALFATDWLSNNVVSSQ